MHLPVQYFFIIMFIAGICAIAMPLDDIADKFIGLDFPKKYTFYSVTCLFFFFQAVSPLWDMPYFNILIAVLTYEIFSAVKFNYWK